MASTKPIVPALDAENADPDKDTKYDFPRDLIGYGRHPPKANWPGGAKIAVSFVINYEEVRTKTTPCASTPNFNLPLTPQSGRRTHSPERRRSVRV